MNPDAAATQSTNKIRILVADDHLVVRQGLQAVLATESDFEVVGEVGDGLQACDQYRKLDPDVLILDLRMPLMNGFEVVRKLNEGSPKPRILIMTTYDTDEDIWRCLRAGAKGYLLKDARHPEIVAAVRAVSAGKNYTSPALNHKLARRASAIDLTPREEEVLFHIAEGSTNKEIANRLGIEAGTVKTHLKSLFQKLEATTRTEAVKKARERGLLRE